MFSVIGGNLLDATEKYLCHQCNCVTKKSKHLSKTVFTRFPHANIYSRRQFPSSPGTIVLKGDGKEERFIINLLGQYYPGKGKFKNDSAQIRFGYFDGCALRSFMRRREDETVKTFLKE